jgi:type II secretory pathway component GspD/PulD (secretin)
MSYAHTMLNRFTLCGVMMATLTQPALSQIPRDNVQAPVNAVAPRVPNEPRAPIELASPTQEWIPGTPYERLPDPPGVPAANTTRNWRFQFQDAPWPAVLRQFAKTNELSLQIQSLPNGEFSYFDDKLYSVSEAIDIFNDYLLPLGYILVRNDSKLTAVAARGDFDDGVVPFVPLSAVSGLGRHELASVAVPVNNANPQAIVDEVKELMSGVGKVRALTNSRRLLLTDTGAYLRRAYDLLNGSGLAASEVDTVVYKLRNTTADLVARAVNDRFNSDQSANPETGQPSGIMFAVPELETNSLLLRGTPDEIHQLQRIIAELDGPAAQVLIQALLVEVALGNTHEAGVELGLQDSVLFNRSVVDNIVTISETVTSANGVQTTNDRIISQTAAPGFNFNSPILGNNTSVSPGRVGSQGLSTFGVGRVNGDLGFGGLVLSAGSESVNVLIRALQAYYKIDILSRPQVRTLDNKEAFIQAGQQVPVVDGVSLTANGNANPVIRQDRAGIILRVTPKVSPDGMVQLTVSAEKSAFQLTPGTGVPIFTDATNGNVIEAPVKDITTAETTVAARTGQTVVLGGLITREKSIVERKVPVLGNIPVLGRLFRYDFDDSQRKELLIFLTPHIINDVMTSDQFTAQESMRLNLCMPDITELHGELFPPELPQPGVAHESGGEAELQTELETIWPTLPPTEEFAPDLDLDLPPQIVVPPASVDVEPPGDSEPSATLGEPSASISRLPRLK